MLAKMRLRTDSEYTLARNNDDAIFVVEPSIPHYCLSNLSRKISSEINSAMLLF